MNNTLLSTSKNYHLYIGFPFCKSKCSFCHYTDNIKFGKTYIDENYMNLVLKQLREVLELNKNKNLESVYFGGGTPSLLSYNQILQIKELIDKYYNPIEVTIEIYPTNWNKDYLNLDFFTRYSIGVQSINNKILKEYKRKDYSWKDCLNIIDVIKTHNKNIIVNLDFLFNETIEKKEIKEINNILVDSIVFYPNTKGKGEKRLANVYKTLNMISKSLYNYKNLYKSKHIFINNNRDIFSIYAKNEYEIFEDIIGIGHNSISNIGNKSFLSLYEVNRYFYKKRYSKRYLISLIESSTTAMNIKNIQQIDKDFLQYTEKFEHNIYFIPKKNYIQFFNFLSKKYSLFEAEVFLSIIQYGDKSLYLR